MVYRLAFLLVLLVVVGSNLFAQTRPPTNQEAAREIEKQWKEWDKAVRKARKDAEKDVRRALKPGSKDLPEGTSRHPAEFPVRKIRPEDLGVALANEGPGVVIEQIDSQGSLARAGFRERDRVLYVDEFQIRDDRDFVKYLFADQVRFGRVSVVVLRGEDQFKELVVVPAELLEEKPPGLTDPLARLGIELGDRAGNDLRVSDVLPQTPADSAGVRRGDVILTFGNKRARSADHLARLIANAEEGIYELRVKRDEAEPTLDVRIK